MSDTQDRKSEALAFKRFVDSGFEKASGLPDRRYYSAFYSLPQQSPVLWLNLNPGGSVEEHIILSDEQLIVGCHEFFDGDGKTSRATGSFLRAVFPDASDAQLRSVQGSNVAWQRSPKGRDINLEAAAARAAPFLRELIIHSKPRIVVFGGVQARDLYLRTAGARLSSTERVVLGNWGRSQARIFIAHDMIIDEVGEVQSLTVSHPSRGLRAAVVEATRVEVRGIVLPRSIARD